MHLFHFEMFLRSLDVEINQHISIDKKYGLIEEFSIIFLNYYLFVHFSKI